jgi:hypothetical protein
MLKAHAVLLAILAAVGACGGGQEPVVSVAGGYAKAFCEYAVRCGTAPDQALCSRVLRSSLGLLEQSLAAGRVHADATVAGRCQALLASDPCTRGFISSARFRDVCGAVFQGTVPAGSRCFSAVDCAGRGVCEPLEWEARLACGRGICGPPRPARSSDGACLTDEDCLTGSACAPFGYDPQTGSSHCVPFTTVADGQSCALVSAKCAANSWCALDDDTTIAVCRALPQDGQSCTGTKCASLASACIGSVCQPRGKLGDVCTADPGENSCRDYLDCVDGTCRRLLEPGEPCSVSGAGGRVLRCATGACVAGFCRDPACDQQHADAAATSG